MTSLPASASLKWRIKLCQVKARENIKCKTQENTKTILSPRFDMNLLTSNVTSAAVIGFLFVLLFGAVWTDTKTYKISNRLIAIGIFSGLLANGLLPEGNGFASSLPGALGWTGALLGMITGFSMLLPLYILRGMGAGDVKLVAMIGAFFGASTVIGIVLITFVIGGVLSLGLALYNKSFGRLFTNLWTMVVSGHFKMAIKDMPTLEVPVVSAGKLPYAIPITLGTASYLYLIHLYPNLGQIF